MSTDRVNIGWYDNYTSWWIGYRSEERQVPATTLDLGIDFDSNNYAVVIRDVDFSSNQDIEFNVTKYGSAFIGSNTFASGFVLNTNLTFDNATVMFRSSNPNNTHYLIYRSGYYFNSTYFYGNWTLVCNNSQGSSIPCGISNHSLGFGSSSDIYIYANVTSLSAYALVFEPYCGDIICQSSENCDTCATDCLDTDYVCCGTTAYEGNCCSVSDCSSGQLCSSHVCTTSSTEEDGGGGGGGGGGDLPDTTTNVTNITTPPTTLSVTGVTQEANEVEADLDRLEDRINVLLSILEDVPLENLVQLQDARNKISSARTEADINIAESLLNDARYIILSTSGELADVEVIESKLIESSQNLEFIEGYNISPINVSISREAKVVNIIKTTGTETRTVFTLTLPLYSDRNFTYFERIPKEVAQNVNEITFNYEPTVLEEDPLVAWAFPAYGEPLDLVYYVQKSIDLQTLPPFENVAAVEILLDCGDEVCDLSEICCEDCGCPSGGTCNTFTHVCESEIIIPGLEELGLQWYHFLSVFVGILILVSFFVYPYMTKPDLAWGEGAAKIGVPKAKKVKIDEKEFEKIVHKAAVEKEAILVVKKKDRDGFWYVVTINEKVSWLFSKIPIGFPIFVTGNMKRAGDMTYLEISTIAKTDHHEKQNVKDVLKTNPKKASLQGSCKCVSIDESGYWYELTDITGIITLHSKKPIYLYGKFKLINKGDYYLIEIPHIMKAEITKVFM
jgi:hypothetical protein